MLRHLYLNRKNKPINHLIKKNGKLNTSNIRTKIKSQLKLAFRQGAIKMSLNGHPAV